MIATLAPALSPVDDARTVKCAALVAVLEASGCAAADAALFDDDGWLAAARAAGVNPPSEISRLLVIGRLAVHEADLEFGGGCPDCEHGNPRTGVQCLACARYDTAERTADMAGARI